jgi:flagellin FlaB
MKNNVTKNPEKEGIIMKGSFVKAIGSFHRGEKGITGLETAIILIAFVTVAAVLAYSVLSAGIFSAERGQEAVYRGLQQAEASMQVAGNVYAQGTVDADPLLSTVDNLSFQLASVLANEDVDLGKCVMNYQDATNVSMNIGNISGLNLVTGLSGLLRPNEVAEITVDVSGFGLGIYDTFTLEIIPPTGASIQMKRTVPGTIDAVINLY